MAAMGVELLVAGAGDAFGSGGRLQTCFCLSGAGPRVLIDCGTTALIGLKRADVDPNDVEAIVVSHLHGDHFGGIPFFVLDGQFRHRERDLLVAGPPGTSERLRVAMDAFFPGSPGIERRFRLDVVELCPGEPTAVGPAIVTGFEVMHASGAPALSVRVGYGGHVSHTPETLSGRRRSLTPLMARTCSYARRISSSGRSDTTSIGRRCARIERSCDAGELRLPI
jgi:hypothetical protein